LKNPRDLSIGDLSVYPQEISHANKQITISLNNQNSRNTQAPQKFNSVDGRGKPVPKLDFKQLKKVQEFKDWYAYACKLEDSVKFLRDRVKSLEADNDSLNEKYRKEVAIREQVLA
jgi:hypothetical protein